MLGEMGSEGSSTVVSLSDQALILPNYCTSSLLWMDGKAETLGFLLSPKKFQIIKRGEKGIGDGTVNYGMDDADDVYMQSWTGTIIGPPNTVHEGRIYQLKFFCGKEYPVEPPSVRFQTRINMSCVNQEIGLVATYFKNDLVNPNLLPLLADWKREYTMEDMLVQLKKEMLYPQNRKTSSTS